MQQQNFNIDITQTTPIVCDKCGCEHFIPIPVYSCHKCGHVNEEFQPKDDAI